MKWQRTFKFFVLTLGGWGFATAALAACPRVGEPAVSVQVVDPGPRVVTTKSIKQINTMAGSHGLSKPGFQVLGMTEISIDSGVKVSYRGQPVGQTVCVNVEKVEGHFGLKKHFVNVPREYPRESCQYNVVLRHEMAHVDVNRRTVRKYADVLKAEVRRALRITGSVQAASMAQGQQAQAAVIQKVVDDVGARFSDELNALHAAIDEPGSKYAAAGQCRGW
ncbi:MAG TPA: hypothetical protein VIN57_07755 [Magnetovibrio sp.]